MTEARSNWKPTTSLRWTRPADTTTQPDKLQQLWHDYLSGREEWRDVPLAVVPASSERKEK